MSCKRLILLASLLLSFLGGAAQSSCGFDVIQKRAMANPLFKSKLDQAEKQAMTNVSRGALSGIQMEQVNAALYTIPVVVHVIHTGDAVGTIYNPSAAQIQGAIDYLNSVYNGTLAGLQGVGDLQIQFQLATRDPNCNATTGINRVNGSSLANYTANGVNVSNTSGEDELTVKNLIRWDPTKYYNIWVVNKFDGQDGTSGTFVGGFAYFPGAPASYDGTMILATQMQSNRKTLPHEMGHAFGVFHPFEGASGATCPTNTDCTAEGDRVCDTDPITQSFSCRSGTNPCTSTPYSINTENNFMSYTNCANVFTAGQKARMLAYAATDYRKYGGWAIGSFPVATYAAPANASCTPVTPTLTSSTNYAGVISMNLNGVLASSGTAFGDGGYMNKTGNCQDLFYLQEGNVYTATLRLYGINAEQARVWIDFNNDGSFNNAEELIGSVNELVHPSGRSSGLYANINFSIPPNAVKETVLRMRVLEDVSTIYGVPSLSTACQNPSWGQAEDYPVFIRSLSVLPVELISFNATANGKDAVLRWQTGTEQNSSRFDVERSANGRDYTKIGEVAAKGVPAVYQYTDRGLAEGAYQYRLKQVDKNGESVYTKSVRVNIASSNTAFKVLTNPASSYVDIGMPVLTSQATARVMDMSGRVLLQRALPAGTGNYRMEGVDRLSPGLYLIEINTGNTRELLKFVKR